MDNETVTVQHNVRGYGLQRNVAIAVRRRLSTHSVFFHGPDHVKVGGGFPGKATELVARLADQLFLLPGVEEVCIQQHGVVLNIGGAFSNEEVAAEARATLELFMAAEELSRY